MCSRNTGSNTTFYHEAANVEEAHKGYLYKSPPSGLIKNMKSWKRRFFVLAKSGDSTCELRYYRNIQRETLIKSIDLSTITVLLNSCPKDHPALDWINKNFKCSPSCVLFMKAKNPTEKDQREYFFVGENRDEADGWFNALSQVLKSTSEPQSMTEFSQSTEYSSCDTDQQVRSISPPNMNESKWTDHSSCEQSRGDPRPALPPRKMSVLEDVKTLHNDCGQPSRRKLSALEMKLDETAEDSSEDIESSGESATEETLMDCVTKAFNNLRTQQTSNDSEVQGTQSTTTKGQDNLSTHMYETERNQHNINELKRETCTPVEMEICVNLNDLNGLIFKEEAGKLCVSECRQIGASCMFQRGDQILTVNDLLTDTVEEIQTYLRKLSKNEAKLTILRPLGSIPMHSEPCLKN